jgi:hypothetical protein
MTDKLVAIQKWKLAESWETYYHYFNFFINAENSCTVNIFSDKQHDRPRELFYFQ